MAGTAVGAAASEVDMEQAYHDLERKQVALQGEVQSLKGLVDSVTKEKTVLGER
jgi:hypothetical protein